MRKREKWSTPGSKYLTAVFWLALYVWKKKKKRTLMRGHHVLRAGKSEHPKGHIRALSPWQETTKSGNSTERERFG